MEGSTILLTGVTGFLAKVVLEELFRRQDEVQFSKVIVLIRPKRGKHHAARFHENVAPSACFQYLQSGWEERVEVVQSELSMPKCGMDSTTYQRLQACVTHIIHCAGSVKFDSPILDAFQSNITSGLNLLEFAKGCQHSPSLTHVSTAYVMPHTKDPIYETLPELPKPAQEIYEDIINSRMTERELLALTTLPNTYTLSKAVTEHLLTERRGHVPLTIIRPSIVSVSRQFPFPGWIDSQAAFAGFVCAIGGGVLHVVGGDPMTLLDIVPVDDVVRLIIDQSLLAQPSLEKPRIRYAVAGLHQGAYVAETANMIADFFCDYVQSQKPWMFYVGNRDALFFMYEFLAQTLPLRLASLWFVIWGDFKKSRMMGILDRKLFDLNAAFAYFTHHSFDFRSTEAIVEDFDARQYVRLACRGALRHLKAFENVPDRKFEFLNDTGVSDRPKERSML